MRIRTKIGLVILLLLSVVFTINQNNKPKQIPAEIPSKIDLPQPIEKKSIQQIIREKHKSNEEKSTEKTKTLVKIDSVYDEDPVVDANLIIDNNRLCISYLTYDKKKTQKYFKRFESILNEKQVKYYQNFYEHCQQLNKQHPEYHLTDLDLIRKQKQKAKANSVWGKIIKGELDVNTLSEAEIAGLLKQNNPNILKQAPQYLSDYYAKVIHWDIEDVLGNHQYNYSQLIQQYAHQLYLCQQGANCGSNSNIMASMCYINDRSCGLDYPQFVQQGLTIGQQADIQLAMGYLKNIYQ